MRFWFSIAVCALAASTGFAQSPAQTFYWCDANRGWYPNVRTCPVPWREVVVKPEGGPQRNEPQAPIELVPRSTADAPAAKPAGQAEYAPPPRLGDGLDDWCGQVKQARSIALCSDAELRALAVERQRAFDEVRARLGPDQQKALLADQKNWLQS